MITHYFFVSFKTNFVTSGSLVIAFEGQLLQNNKEEEDKLVSRVPLPPEKKGERKLCYFIHILQVPLQRIYIATKGTRPRHPLTALRKSTQKQKYH